MRIATIAEDGPKGAFNAARYLATHKHIFQDVYEWAGEPRTINIGKQEREGGQVTWFAPPARILPMLEAHLGRGLDLRSKTDAEFVARCAHGLSGLNQIHPFREGNGRTQQTFIRQAAEVAGREVNFAAITRERMIAASIAVKKGDLAPMVRLFEDASDPARAAILSGEITKMERGGIKTGDWSILIARKGEQVSGKLVLADEARGLCVIAAPSSITLAPAELARGVSRGGAVNGTASREYGRQEEPARQRDGRE